ncbi:MAG: alpha/beta hydrolase, partial [Muribaculaceae bacterium]|nr:alpha/beta hydrolase [Muribaculaceae bacterium]
MEKFLELDNGMRVKYDLIGDGPAIILMHGWGCQSSTLNSIANIAAEQHTVYNLDLPGFGKSDEPREVWGVDEYARMLEEFVSKLGIENPIVLGHSYGGRIGILYSSRNSVDKLILVDAAGIKPKRSLKYYFKVYSFKAGKHLTRLFLGKVKAEERIEAMRKKKGSSDYAGSSQMMRAVMSKSVNQDLKYAMPAIKAPTLLIWGENDTATPLRDAKIMEKLIPDAGLVSFPGCGHYSFLDNPH